MKNLPSRIMNLSASDILLLLRALINTLSTVYNIIVAVHCVCRYVSGGTVEHVATEERLAYL